MIYRRWIIYVNVAVANKENPQRLDRRRLQHTRSARLKQYGEDPKNESGDGAAQPLPSHPITHWPNAGYELRRAAPPARWPCSAAAFSGSRIGCAANFEPARGGCGSPIGLKPARS